MVAKDIFTALEKDPAVPAPFKTTFEQAMAGIDAAIKNQLSGLVDFLSTDNGNSYECLVHVYLPTQD